MSEAKKRFNVVSPVERKDGKTFWVRIGVGYANRDNSINMYLDALPVNQRLQLRVADDDEKLASDGSRRPPSVRAPSQADGSSAVAPF
ncbi:MAG: hypothetical protein IPL79_12090 [Myxococcales bacterium]|nr:hypothetical protein [Myxococcales bacterium]